MDVAWTPGVRSIGRLRQETNSTDYQPIVERLSVAKLVDQTQLPGAEAVLSISTKSSEADLVRGFPTMIDLTEIELGGEHLAVIMRWLPSDCSSIPTPCDLSRQPA